MLAICYKEVGDDSLRQFEEEVILKDNFKLLQDSFIFTQKSNTFNLKEARLLIHLMKRQKRCFKRISSFEVGNFANFVFAENTFRLHLLVNKNMEMKA